MCTAWGGGGGGKETNIRTLGGGRYETNYLTFGGGYETKYDIFYLGAGAKQKMSGIL